MNARGTAQEGHQRTDGAGVVGGHRQAQPVFASDVTTARWTRGCEALETGCQVGLVELVFGLQFTVAPRRIYIMNSSLEQLFLVLLFSLNLFLASEAQPTLGPGFQPDSSINPFLT